MRRTIQNRQGVDAGEVRSGERNRLDVRGRLDAVEEPGIELPGLQLSDKRSLGVDVRRRRRDGLQSGDVVRLGRLVESRDSQDTFRVRCRVGTTDQKTGLVDDVVPRLGFRSPANLLEGL